MNRDMYYQNLNQGYQNPGMIIPPSGYNLNTNYQAYGPNVMPNNMPYQNNNYNGANYNNGYDIETFVIVSIFLYKLLLTNIFLYVTILLSEVV